MIKIKATLTILFIVTLSFFSQFSFSQVKKQGKVSLEIDRLYAKYKDLEGISISFPEGSIYMYVHTDLNDDNKPSEITLSAKSPDIDNIFKFINYFIKQKVQKGFKEDGETINSSSWGVESMKFDFDSKDIKFTFIKGTQYTLINLANPKRNSFIFGESSSIGFYDISITTGDTKRTLGSKSENFDF